ncbi:MAG: hypothetical protein RIF41_14050 [Polyangiaceae bacterium]
MRNAVLVGVLLGGLAMTAIGCGGAVPSMSGTRESGQSGLMDDTFAGKNACNPENHTRPFIIEWDGTDMASFEDFAAKDVVVVKYEGCNLKVLDRCRDDSVPGTLGAYKPVEWTSGSLETIDIRSEGELGAKLPLGVVTLGGRVKAGEKFHMEYFVAGTRTSTRPDVYQDDLSKLSECAGATHFVYNYNLGAFALGSVQSFDATASGSIYGFGADGSTSKGRSAEKNGGDLEVCKSDVMAEVEGCKTPIRLTLRSIKPGSDPGRTTDDTDASLNAAAKVDQKVEAGAAAKAHLASAKTKLSVGDGAGCLKELDAHDQADPKFKSTDPKSGPIAGTRAECLMLTGQCQIGKKQLAKAIMATKGQDISAQKREEIVNITGAQRCRGGDTDDWTKMVAAFKVIGEKALSERIEASECLEAYKTLDKLAPKVKPKNADDKYPGIAKKNYHHYTAMCLAKAGSCKKGFEIFYEGRKDEVFGKQKRDKAYHQVGFENIFPDCKGKI